jgi:putative transposase
LLHRLGCLYAEFNGIYGYRRLADELNTRYEISYNYKRVYRLTQLVGLKAVIRRKRPQYQRSTPEVTAENILNRDFAANKSNEKWLTDVTEFKYGDNSKLYLSAILDLKDKSIVSFAISRNNNNQLVFDTFDLAVSQHPDAHPIFHSDRGFQYTSKQFKNRLDMAGMKQSMSRVGRCIDNGPMEGFWGILKCEMYYLRTFKVYDNLVEAIKSYIYFYNYERRQKNLNKMSPMTYRQLLENAA